MLNGKTRIEMKDIHTGMVEVIEEENMVTNALQYIFNPMGYVKAADPMVTTEYVNYYTTLTGGLSFLSFAFIGSIFLSRISSLLSIFGSLYITQDALKVQ